MPSDNEWVRKIFFMTQWKQPCLTLPMELKPMLSGKKVQIKLLNSDPLELFVRVIPEEVKLDEED